MTNKPAASQKKSGSQTIFWWVVWILLTIGSFFVAAAIWTPILYKHFGSVRENKASIAWVTAVFGTWMAILVPLIIVMYSKVDKAYEDARIRREKNAARFRSIFVEPSKRALPEPILRKLSAWPKTIEEGQLVHVTLKDGRRFSNVFVSEQKEILGIYNETEFPFEGKDVTDVELSDLKEGSPLFANQWLRLDGVQAPE